MRPRAQTVCVSVIIAGLIVCALLSLVLLHGLLLGQEHADAVAHVLHAQPPKQPSVRLSVCTVVKDEALHIAEWVAFHVLEGVGRFVLYDDGSDDGLADVLADAVRLGVVTIVPWPSAAFQSSFNDSSQWTTHPVTPHLCDSAYYVRHPDKINHCQLVAFDHCLAHYHQRGQADWVLFIDVDEFAFTTTNGIEQTLGDVLAMDRFSSASSVGMVAATYGSSGYRWALPRGKLLVTTAFRRRSHRAPTDDSAGDEAFGGENYKIKSAVRPARVQSGRCGAHMFADRGQPRSMTTLATDGRPYRGCGDNRHDPRHCLLVGCGVLEPEWGLMRYNHYRTRTLEDHLVKQAKGIVQGRIQTKQHFTDWDLVDRNDVVDMAAVKRLAERQREQLHRLAPDVQQLVRSLERIHSPVPTRTMVVVGPEATSVGLIASALTVAGSPMGSHNTRVTLGCEKPNSTCSPAEFPLGFFKGYDGLVNDPALCSAMGEWLQKQNENGGLPVLVVLVAPPPARSVALQREWSGLDSNDQELARWLGCLTHVVRSVRASGADNRLLFVPAEWTDLDSFCTMVNELVVAVNEVAGPHTLIRPSKRRIKIMFDAQAPLFLYHANHSTSNSVPVPASAANLYVTLSRKNY